MSGEAADYHRGDMDITEQVTTFRDAMKVSKWASLAVAVGVLFFTLLFCTATGFVGSLAAAVVVTALGVFLFRGPTKAH